MALGGIMDFVQRFQSLQIQRDSSDELIKVGSASPPGGADMMQPFVDLSARSSSSSSLILCLDAAISM
jgi:hypothetical protein